MKTFIFLFMVIMAFFIYIFTGNAGTKVKQPVSTPKTDALPTLDDIESEMEKTAPFETTASVIISKQQAISAPDTEPFNESAIPPISEHLTFDQLKNILLVCNPYYPKSSITLNTPVASILRTKAEKETFKSKIANTFHLNSREVEHYMQKNKLLWDWVNLLQ